MKEITAFMGDINVRLANGAIGGVVNTGDGIVGMVMTGDIDDGGYVLGTPVLITGLASLAAAGITAAGNPFAYRQVKEFYDEAGNGAQLYLMLVPNTALLTDMADHTNANGAKKLLDYAGKIRVLGIMTNDAEVYGGGVTLLHGLNTDVYAAAAAMELLAGDYFDLERPFRAIVGGSSYTGVAGDLSDLLMGTNNRTAILVGDSVSDSGCAALGVLLGRMASIPVMRKVSRVANGSLKPNVFYLGATAINDPSLAGVPDIINNKGFITIKQYAQTDGFFFSGDHTLSATTDDYHSLVHGRVIDKAHVLVYGVYVLEVDDEIPTIDGGFPEPTWAKHIEALATSALDTNMTGAGEVSAASAFVPLDQVVTGDGATFAINVRLRPVGYMTDIEVSLGFEV